MAQTSLITGAERRRRWSEAEKLAVVAAAFAPGANVSDVARRTDISTSLIYRWRKDFDPEPGGFARAVLRDERANQQAEAVSAGPVIVVEMAGGVRVTIGAEAQACVIAAVLRALR
jgi:transposase